MPEQFGSHYELARFSGTGPIFPLPDTVFFPYTYLPLYIFEPRYREMTRDALSGERIICMALLQEGWEDEYDREPPIHPIGTIGYITEQEALEEGKYNILLQGLAKVHIRELESTTPYRKGEMDLIMDSAASWAVEQERERLLARFKNVVRLIEADLPIDELEAEDLSLELLVNLLATWLPIPVTEKQKLLEVKDIVMRSEIVREYLRQEMEDLSSLDGMNFIFPDNPRWN